MTALTDSAPQAAALNPLLRWAGSKRKLIPVLRRYWPARTRKYIEPFAGSAAFFFAMRPRRAVLGDMNEEICVLLTAVKSDPLGIAKVLHEWPRTKSTFLRLRAIQPDTLSSTTRAARLLFLNHNCFNGLYRTNMSGGFNTPYSSARRAQMPSLDSLVAASDALRYVKPYHGDFEKVVRESTTSNSFVYLDPPFYVTSRRVFNEYGPTEFSLNDTHRLRQLLRWLDRRAVPFLVSYADSVEARRLSQGFHTRVVLTTRNIGGFVETRRLAREILISNVEPVELS